MRYIYRYYRNGDMFFIGDTYSRKVNDCFMIMDPSDIDCGRDMHTLDDIDKYYCSIPEQYIRGNSYV